MGHLDTVRNLRAQYGTPLGLEHAWRISNGVCLAHAAEGWGLVDKPGGSNWQGYSVDVILNRYTGEAVDVLGDSEGNGWPQWSVLSPDQAPTVNRWRQPVDVITPPPPDPDPDPTPLEARVTTLEIDLAALRALLRRA
jgi:hypothetical protein